MKSADLVVEGEYETGAQEQLYIENNGMIAAWQGDGDASGVTVWGSLQCPYDVQKALMKLFDVPAEKARGLKIETGSRFGGKEGYPSIETAPYGAFRGFVAPQSLFALERHIDVIARRLKMSPIELRRMNFVKKGETLATGQVVRDDVDMGLLLDKALMAAGYHEKRARFAV